MALDGEEFTKTAQSYVSTYMSHVNAIIRPLADAWGDIAHADRISLRQWLGDEHAEIRTLVLQRDADREVIKARPVSIHRPADNAGQQCAIVSLKRA